MLSIENEYNKLSGYCYYYIYKMGKNKGDDGWPKLHHHHIIIWIIEFIYFRLTIFYTCKECMFEDVHKHIQSSG